MLTFERIAMRLVHASLEIASGRADKVRERERERKQRERDRENERERSEEREILEKQEREERR
jgi:hypothetical protein